jgi:probable HAF family extracellular repeat protein
LSTIGAVLWILLIPLTGASGTTFTGLGDLPGGKFQSDATAVSADGTVAVGRSASAAGDEGFRWKSGDNSMVGLGDLPGGHYASTATGVSSDGNVWWGGVTPVQAAKVSAGRLARE